MIPSAAHHNHTRPRAARAAPHSRRRTLAAAIAALLAHGATAHATDFTWLGGNGNFSAANWSSPGFPNAGTADVFIDGGNVVESVVELDVSTTVGNLTIDAGDALNILEGRRLTTGGGIFTNQGTLTLLDTSNNGGVTGLVLNADTTLAGAGVTRLDSAGSNLDAFIDTSSATATTLTIDTGHTVTGDGRIGGVLTNNLKVVNQGALRAEGGTLRLDLSDDATPGLDNTGGTVDLAASGHLQLNTGTLSGGILQGSGGSLGGSAGGTLRDLTLTGSVDLAEGNRIGIAGTVTTQGTFTLLDTSNNGGVTGLVLNADTTLAGTGVTRLDSAGSLLDAFIDNSAQAGLTRTLTIDTGHSVTGDGRIGGVLTNSLKLVNQGTLRAEGGPGARLQVTTSGPDGFLNRGRIEVAEGSTLAVSGAPLVQSGDNTASIAVAGELNAALVNLDAGTLLGTGTVIGTVVNAAHVGPGNSPGVLTINGVYTQQASGTLDIELGSLANFDLLDVNGTANLDGTLALHCVLGCEFAVGDSLTILDASANSLFGAFSAVSLFGFATGQFDIVYDRALGDVRLLVTEAPSPVPLPAGGWLLLGGLGLLGARGRRLTSR